MCPADEVFPDFAVGYTADIARSGVDVIMLMVIFDTDFFGDAPGCVYENHLRLISIELGEKRFFGFDKRKSL